MIMKFAQYLDLGLLTAGCVVLVFGLARAGLTACLIGGGLALVALGLYGKRG